MPPSGGSSGRIATSISVSSWRIACCSETPGGATTLMPIVRRPSTRLRPVEATVGSIGTSSPSRTTPPVGVATGTAASASGLSQPLGAQDHVEAALAVEMLADPDAVAERAHDRARRSRASSRIR